MSRAIGLLLLLLGCPSDDGSKGGAVDTAISIPGTGGSGTGTGTGGSGGGGSGTGTGTGTGDECLPECDVSNDEPRDPVVPVETATYHLSGRAWREAGQVQVVLNPVVKTGTGDRVRNLTEEQVSLTVDGAPLALVELAKVDDEHPVSYDIVFVIDTTGSMFWAIDGVQAGVRAFLDGVAATGVDAKVGAIEYGDEVRTSIDLTNAGSVRSWVGDLEARGGDDPAENALDPILVAYETFSWRPDAQRFIVLVTDQGMHECSVGCASHTLADVVAATRGNVLYGVVHAAVFEPSGLDPKLLTRTAGGLYVGLDAYDLLGFDIAADTRLDELVGDTHVITAEDAPDATHVTVTVSIDDDVAELTLPL